jgi:outer membrane protein assembly factor BamB
MRRLAFTFLFIIILVSPSCTMKQPHTVEEETEAVIADTLPPVVFGYGLPDTMYVSAEKVKFVVDTFDTSVPCELKDFEDLYGNTQGILMFRGSPTRNPNFCGHLYGDSIDINVDWVFETEMDTSKTSHGTWYGGTGWTGQPLYVQWPDSLLQRFEQLSDTLIYHLCPQELIIASLCGNVYFIDFQTGLQSRQHIDTKNVLKGTPSLNPLFNGHLYVGHGVEKSAPFGNIVFDMLTHHAIHTFGRDAKAWRSWGAYDSSPVIIGGFLFRPGENGTVYKYYIGDGGYTLQSTLRYSLTKYKSSPGIESSMAVYKNYGYISDNCGNILCLNLNTMKPVWHYWNHDDTDATPIVDVEKGIPFVYTGCEVDCQGNTGKSYFVKLNGLTGELVWEDTIPCCKHRLGSDKILDGGMYGSPLLGDGDCDSMIFSNFCINTTDVRGYFTAFDKNDGRILYQTKTKQYSWSSPVAFYNDKNEMFIFTADAGGVVYLIKGKTGEIVATKKVGSNFESSPIIIDNKIVLGSRGNKIYKISLQ